MGLRFWNREKRTNGSGETVRKGHRGSSTFFDKMQERLRPLNIMLAASFLLSTSPLNTTVVDTSRPKPQAAFQLQKRPKLLPQKETPTLELHSFTRDSVPTIYISKRDFARLPVMAYSPEAELFYKIPIGTAIPSILFLARVAPSLLDLYFTPGVALVIGSWMFEPFSDPTYEVLNLLERWHREGVKEVRVVGLTEEDVRNVKFIIIGRGINSSIGAILTAISAGAVSILDVPAWAVTLPLAFAYIGGVGVDTFKRVNKMKLCYNSLFHGKVDEILNNCSR